MTPSILETGAAVLEVIPGGATLLAWFGKLPKFGDAEILDLHLDRNGPSTLRLHAMERDAVVAFTLIGIIDLKLEGFSPQNVIGSLEIQRVNPQLQRFGMEWLDPPPNPEPHYQFVLKPVYGLSGLIQARKVSIAFTPGRPELIG